MAHFILIILLHTTHRHHGHHHSPTPDTSCVVRIRGVYYRPGVVFCPTPGQPGDDTEGSEE